MPFILLNDGSSVVLLNDGTSKVLLNDKAFGPVLAGTHATQALYKKTPEQLITVRFEFKLVSNLIKRIEIRLEDFTDKLHPNREYLKQLSKSYTLNLSETYNTIKKLKVRLVQEARIKDIVRTAKRQKLKEILLKKLKEYMND